MAGATELISKNSTRDQKEIRAKRRVFFDYARLFSGLVLSLAFHLLGVFWLSKNNSHNRKFDTNQQVYLTLPDLQIRSVLNSLAFEEKSYPRPTKDLNKKREKKEQLITENKSSPSTLKNTYLPREVLSQPPVLIEDVDLHSIETIFGKNPRNIVFHLFISNQGRVDFVEAEPGEHDYQIEARLSELLLKLKFSEGKVNEKPVNSRIKIEVFFMPKSEASEGTR